MKKRKIKEVTLAEQEGAVKKVGEEVWDFLFKMQASGTFIRAQSQREGLVAQEDG